MSQRNPPRWGYKELTLNSCDEIREKLCVIPSAIALYVSQDRNIIWNNRLRQLRR